jgi:hypothetical protein
MGDEVGDEGITKIAATVLAMVLIALLVGVLIDAINGTIWYRLETQPAGPTTRQPGKETR